MIFLVWASVSPRPDTSLVMRWCGPYWILVRAAGLGRPAEAIRPRRQDEPQLLRAGALEEERGRPHRAGPVPQPGRLRPEDLATIGEAQELKAGTQALHDHGVLGILP